MPIGGVGFDDGVRSIGWLAALSVSHRVGVDAYLLWATPNP